MRGGRGHRDRRLCNRAGAPACLPAVIGCLLICLAVSHGSALADVVAPRSTAAPVCRGEARRVEPGHVSFSFSCGEDEDVTAFLVRANRTLHSVYDPSYAFGCERSTSRSFDCADIHSGAGPEGSGVASVSEPLCRRGAHLVLRVTPTLDFEARPLRAFTLKGPC
jgi:hypothetical protein